MDAAGAGFSAAPSHHQPNPTCLRNHAIMSHDPFHHLSWCLSSERPCLLACYHVQWPSPRAGSGPHAPLARCRLRISSRKWLPRRQGPVARRGRVVARPSALSSSSSSPSSCRFVSLACLVSYHTYSSRFLRKTSHMYGVPSHVWSTK